MNPKMQSLIDAPLADPLKLYLPDGKRTMKRGPRERYCDEEAMPKGLTREQLNKRKDKAFGEKLTALLDYYATTNVPAAKVAEHLGIYRQQQDGADDKGKPIFIRVLDVERVEAQLAWRRAKAA